MFCDSQGPPCGPRREMKLSPCRWGSPWCCSADPLLGCPLQSSSGWITVCCLHAYTSTLILQTLKDFTVTLKDCTNKICIQCSLTLDQWLCVMIAISFYCLLIMAADDDINQEVFMDRSDGKKVLRTKPIKRCNAWHLTPKPPTAVKL